MVGTVEPLSQELFSFPRVTEKVSGKVVPPFQPFHFVEERTRPRRKPTSQLVTFSTRPSTWPRSTARRQRRGRRWSRGRRAERGDPMTTADRMLLDEYMAEWHRWIARDERRARERRLQIQAALLRLFVERQALPADRRREC